MNGDTNILALLERLPVTAVISDPATGLIRWANTRDLSLIGATSAEQVIGRNLLDFIAPDQHATALEGIESVSAGADEPPVVYHLNRVHGGVVHVEIRSTRIVFQGTPAMLSIVLDVTDRVDAMHECADAEVRFARLAEMSGDGVIVVADDEIVFINGVLASALGASSPTELLGACVYDFIPGRQQLGLRERRRDLVQGKLDETTMVATLRSLDGREFDVTIQGGIVQWRGQPATLTRVRDLPRPTR